MNLKRLQAFRAVYETGSVTAGAQRLHMTQPAVSRLIGDLEKELGLQHRKARGSSYRLTSALATSSITTCRASQ
jgi:DNA-binding transcriptional LysR family regulator